MSWRKQNVLSLVVIAVLVALNALPVAGPRGIPGEGRRGGKRPLATVTLWYPWGFASRDPNRVRAAAATA